MTLQSLRKRIYQLAELEVLLLLIIGVLKVTSVWILSFGNLPIRLLGESFNLLNLIALLLLSGTIAVQYSTPEDRLTGKEIGVLLFFTATIYKVALAQGLSIKYGILGILAVSGTVGVRSLFTRSYILRDAGKNALYAVNVMCLISMATAFIISYPSGGTLIMLSVGVYHILARFENALLNHELWPDPIEIIYRSIINLSFGSTGTVYAGLSLVALFWTLYLGPPLVFAPASIDAYTDLSRLPFSTNIFQIIFTVFLSIYWLSLLRRLPASVEHWQRKRFEWDIYSNLPPRPQLRHLLLFFTGWILAIAPQYISQVQGRFYGSRYNPTISGAYTLLLLLGILLAFISLLPTTRGRIRFNFVSQPGSVKRDHWVIKWSFGIVFALIVYGTLLLRGSPYDLVYLLSFALAVTAEVDDRVPSRVWAVFPLVVILLPTLTTSSSVYWDILFFLSIGYSSMKLSEGL